MNFKHLFFFGLLATLFYQCKPECCCTNIDINTRIVFVDKDNKSIFNNKAVLDSFKVFNVQNGQLITVDAGRLDSRTFALDTLFDKTIAVDMFPKAADSDGWARQIIQFRWNLRDTVEYHENNTSCTFTYDEVRYNGVTKYKLPSTTGRKFTIVKNL